MRQAQQVSTVLHAWGPVLPGPTYCEGVFFASVLLAAAVAGFADTAVAQGMLRGMGAVSAGLIVAVGIKLMAALKTNPMGQLTCALIGVATFMAIGLLRVPLAWVLLSVGPLACVWAGHCIRKRESP